MQNNQQMRADGLRKNRSAEPKPSLRRKPLVAHGPVVDDRRSTQIRGALGGLVLIVGLSLMVCWRFTSMSPDGGNAVIVMASLAMLMGLSMMGPLFGLNIFAGMGAAIESLSGGDSSSLANDGE